MAIDLGAILLLGLIQVGVGEAGEDQGQDQGQDQDTRGEDWYFNMNLDSIVIRFSSFILSQV